MKNIKRIISILVVLCLCLSFTACHKKGETAVEVGDLKFDSGYYACVFFYTDAQARSKVQSQLSEAGESTENIDYSKQKIDDKDYADWVKDETIKTIKHIAAYKSLCAKADVKPASDEQVKPYAENYYDSAEETFEKNGISKETYLKYEADTGYADLAYTQVSDENGQSTVLAYVLDMSGLSYEEAYFNYLFGAEGKKAVTEEQLKNELSANYVLADVIDIDFSTMTDEEKTNSTKMLNGYLEELKSGKRTFEEINTEYEASKKTDDGTDGTAETATTETAEQQETATDEQTADGETAEEELKPLDSLAKLIGNKDNDTYSGYVDYFDDISAMKAGEVKIIDKADDAGKILVVKKDVVADPYYLKTYDSMLRHSVADEDFEKEVDDFIDDAYFKEYTHATGNFKIKKIYYPETKSN